MINTVKDLIISLTSYPKRIANVHEVILSLFEQSILPEKIILWLAEDQFPNKDKDLPDSLLKLKNDIFEIRYCKDIRSYKKLIPALKEFPTKAIITCDDDLILEKHTVENLYNSYKRNPDVIWTNRAHYITLNKDDSIKKYNKWVNSISYHTPSYNTFLTGGAGTLYPPNCLYKDITDEKLFTKLCPDTDDIWFWAMAVLNNKKIAVIKHNTLYTPVITNDEEALFNKNCINGNDKNIENLVTYYPNLLAKLNKKLPLYFYLQKIFSIKKTAIQYNKLKKIEKVTITIFGMKIHK